ncbi:hypothetical protein PAE9249_00398 [Paenibacillus sp. CECT 9249]|nr:hypothetical protein PAE9249_00398 [Paenibacillus sp. CECT 9249]
MNGTGSGHAIYFDLHVAKLEESSIISTVSPVDPIAKCLL